MYSTVEEIFDHLSFNKEECVEKIDIFFNVLGNASYLLHIEDGKLDIHRNPKYVSHDAVLITLNAEDLLNCVNGNTDLQTLLLQGNLKIDADLKQVLRLPVLFPKE